MANLSFRISEIAGRTVERENRGGRHKRPGGVRKKESYAKHPHRSVGEDERVQMMGIFADLEEQGMLKVFEG